MNNTGKTILSTKRTCLESCRILIIGAGGIGCELLKNLVGLGFKNLHIVDMDTIEISNLNRQFLFDEKDIGQSKALVAANKVSKRFDVPIIGYHSKIEDFDKTFYCEFHIIVAGLDSISSRRWMNSMLHSIVEFDKNGKIIPSTIIPLIDGGSEGLKGNVRIIIPGITSCFECNLDLFPQKKTYAVCTIANTPRLPEHCIEYARMISWEKNFPITKSLDLDDVHHINWIYEEALKRASFFGIIGVTKPLTINVLKSIIPAVSSTNSIVAGICATEVFKLVTECYEILNNFLYLSIDDSVYSHLFKAENRSDCSVCSRNTINLDVHPEDTLQTVVNLLTDSQLSLKSPGISTIIDGQPRTLYIPNIPFLEKTTRSNLHKPLKELGLSADTEIFVTDITSPKPIHIKLRFSFNL